MQSEITLQKQWSFPRITKQLIFFNMITIILKIFLVVFWQLDRGRLKTKWCWLNANNCNFFRKSWKFLKMGHFIWRIDLCKTMWDIYSFAEQSEMSPVLNKYTPKDQCTLGQSLFIWNIISPMTAIFVRGSVNKYGRLSWLAAGLS